MTATTPDTVPAPAVEARGGAAFPRLLAMEWTKLRSVRSTVWSLLAFVILTLGLSALLTWLQVNQWDKLDPSQQESYRRDATGNILGSGFVLGQLAICVLGAMVITTEYSTGMIRASVLAAPKRTPMLAAKVVVFAVVTFVIGEIVAFGAFFIAAPIIHSKVQVSLGDKGVLRALFGAGLYLMMLGLFALAIGALLRQTAAAITGVIAFVEVLAPLAQLLPGSWGKHVHAYLPTEAGHLVAQTVPGKNDLLSAWQGFGVFTLWTALLLVVAGWLLKRRDA
ncbi:ABC-2 type transport system permease protein [Catenulispora sp. MAP12-49]|jgi:ABC-2 type transport system permease protein|uniref:ABC transporter permease subunit n=1 Tax=unclassified Catenulispora TaxID=414885 RepID=UPI003514D796